MQAHVAERKMRGSIDRWDGHHFRPAGRGHCLRRFLRGEITHLAILPTASSMVNTQGGVMPRVKGDWLWALGGLCLL
jgi:hypothetical protein